MTQIEDRPFARLEKEGRLLNAVHKGPTEKPGRIGFRGELDAVADAALKFNDSFEAIAYAESLEPMGLVRNRHENGPV